MRGLFILGAFGVALAQNNSVVADKSNDATASADSYPTGGYNPPPPPPPPEDSYPTGGYPGSQTCKASTVTSWRTTTPGYGGGYPTSCETDTVTETKNYTLTSTETVQKNYTVTAPGYPAQPITITVNHTTTETKYTTDTDFVTTTDVSLLIPFHCLQIAPQFLFSFLTLTSAKLPQMKRLSRRQRPRREFRQWSARISRLTSAG